MFSFTPASASIKRKVVYGKGWIRMTQEALSSLKALGDQLRLQLLESPEFRALTVVERTISELSEILSSCAPPPPSHPAPAPVDTPSVESVAVAPSIKPQVQTAASGPVASQKPPAEPIATVTSIKPHGQAAAPAPINSQRPSGEPVATVTSIRPHLQTTLGPINAQSRMAKAIAATIAAKAPPLGSLSADGSRFTYPLSAAS
jgi:hypothetical protein